MRARDYLYINNIKQEKFAELLDIGKEHLNGIINGRYKCTKRVAKDIEELTKGTVTAEEMLLEYSRRKKE